MMHTFSTVLLPDIPTDFPYPFHYIPDELAKIAVEETKKHLLPSLENQHDFGKFNSASGLGKMIGVLVVRNQEGKLGFLAAFSGKLDVGNIVEGWVPPIFDTLDPAEYYIQEEQVITKINKEIHNLEDSQRYITLTDQLKRARNDFENEIEGLKSTHKINKELRKQIRLSRDFSKEMESRLNNESIHDHYILKDRKKHWNNILTQIESQLQPVEVVLDKLKKERKDRSVKLQNKLFESYNFLNVKGESKNLIDIFVNGRKIIPPSGSGECTAPKLLQYAFKNRLTPITMAEFWWGKSPDSEIRVHNNFYPACTGKCKPILSHMLDGFNVAKNPLKIDDNLTSLDVIWEDPYILVINKPANFLTVPGKDTQHSVLTILKKIYPHASGPLIVHRLDMSTSGILVVAKTKDVHQHLQNQFSKRKIKKMYTAILEKTPSIQSGDINLPLRVDIDNRPKQLVCFQFGKTAQTRIEMDTEDKTYIRVFLFPITGRTHQLRVHCADKRGLNAPIKGDDLYGSVSDRLYLHATEITFLHPVTSKTIHLRSEPPF
ncbi:MAG: RluA family pseudouridine synthase [Saprospiraceae bacterium]